MRKVGWFIGGLFLSIALVACGKEVTKKETSTSTTATSTQVENSEASISIKTDDDSTDYKVNVKKTKNLLEALKAVTEVTEDKGFITAIGGVEQNAAENKYWLIKINGKMAEKGAADIALQAGDKVEFYLGSF
ncbi:MAG: DUF4430 domain-containing protein [Lactobacillales bacterium]|jgi:hypothetical protein|nr:DUF4430 domain-containing protein [Lactobacillales bacterium]